MVRQSGLVHDDGCLWPIQSSLLSMRSLRSTSIPIDLRRVGGSAMLDAYRTHGEHFILGDGKVCASEKKPQLATDQKLVN